MHDEELLLIIKSFHWVGSPTNTLSEYFLILRGIYEHRDAKA
jgi:hypothetical protein